MGFFRRRKRKKSQLERILQENPEILKQKSKCFQTVVNKQKLDIMGIR